MSLARLKAKIAARIAETSPAPERRALGEPPADPDMVFVAHCVHAMTAATPAAREMVRRYSRHFWGELAPEETYPPLDDIAELFER
jgi:hypothetical protein